MKTALLLVGVFAAFAFADKTAVADQSVDLTNIFANADRVVKGLTDSTGHAADGSLQRGLLERETQKAVAGDLDLKMLMMDDGSSKGKCYCSCNLNHQPVFMELDSSNVLGNYAVV